MAARGRTTRNQPPDPKKIPDFNQQDLIEIRQAFDIFDKSGSGVIDLGEMLDYLEALKVNEKYVTVYHLIEALFDKFPDGISFKEFMEHAQFLLGDIHTDQGLTRLFELLDVENKQYLDKQRLTELAREIGENVSEEELDELIEDYYECPNGKIDVDSFFKMMIKSAF